MKREQDFILGHAKNLPLKEDTFQKVFSSHVIEHFAVEDGRELVSEWFRVLKKGGTFELICPNVRSARILRTYIFKEELPQSAVYAGGQHKAGYSPKTIRNLIRENAIDIRFVHKMIVPHYVWPPTSILERILVRFFPTFAGDIHLLATKK